MNCLHMLAELRLEFFNHIYITCAGTCTYITCDHVHTGMQARGYKKSSLKSHLNHCIKGNQMKRKKKSY